MSRSTFYDIESDVTKDGRFSCRQIFSYLSDGQYPPGFSKADKLALRELAEWLEDMIINFAQTLLHKQFATPGLQNTALGYTLAYDVMCEPFVRILHNGQGYWLTVSNIGLQSTCMIVCIPPYQAKLKIKLKLGIPS